MSERESFEVWWKKEMAYCYTSESEYYAALAAWQASREALKAEQPASEGFMCVPVADLYELMHKGGEAYSYTSSASDAVYWVKEGYTVREYVLLDRLQDAINHPIDTTSQQYEALSKGESK